MNPLSYWWGKGIRWFRRNTFCIWGYHKPFPMLIRGWVWTRCQDCGMPLSRKRRIPQALTILPSEYDID